MINVKDDHFIKVICSLTFPVLSLFCMTWHDQTTKNNLGKFQETNDQEIAILDFKN
jgi:hypothetical protein